MSNRWKGGFIQAFFDPLTEGPLVGGAGPLYSWGAGAQGMTGQGDTINRSSPVQIGSLTNWSDVTPGFLYAHAQKADGTLWAWGANAYGVFGTGNNVYASSPVQVGALTTWSQVAHGPTSWFSAALKTDGSLWTWGIGNNSQLGDGSSTSRSSPVQVGALTDWAKIEVGAYFCAAIKTDGTLWTWGIYNVGALGQNNAVTYNSPVQVGALTTWLDIACGNYHTIARKTDGTIWTWGTSEGLGGQNNNVVYSSPVQVGALTNWSKVFAGSYSTFAITTDGALWSWGSNTWGQLGQNDTIRRSSPVQVGTLLNWSKVDCDGESAVDTASAIKTDGTLWTWGNNAKGTLGVNDIIARSSPVQLGALATWDSAKVGGSDGTGGSNFILAIEKT